MKQRMEHFLFSRENCVEEHTGYQINVFRPKSQGSHYQNYQKSDASDVIKIIKEARISSNNAVYMCPGFINRSVNPSSSFP